MRLRNEATANDNKWKKAKIDQEAVQCKRTEQKEQFDAAEESKMKTTTKHNIIENNCMGLAVCLFVCVYR